MATVTKRARQKDCLSLCRLFRERKLRKSEGTKSRKQETKGLWVSPPLNRLKPTLRHLVSAACQSVRALGRDGRPAPRLSNRLRPHSEAWVSNRSEAVLAFFLFLAAGIGNAAWRRLVEEVISSIDITMASSILGPILDRR